jgi:4-carboxymuconolactone decarboxylase
MEVPMKLLAVLVALIFAAGLARPARSTTKEDTLMAASALHNYKEKVLLGDVWRRPGLSARDRSIVTLAALITRQQTAEMADYFALSLDHGVKPSEVSEIITHLAFYAGWGNAVAAAGVARDVFVARSIAANQLSPVSPTLLPLNEAAEADRAKRVGNMFGAVFPGVTQYTTDILFRNLWLRPALAPRDRSLVTIGSLVASGQVAQLGGHINIGMNNGLKQDEIAEVLTHLAFYVGWPNVFSAMPVAKETFETRPH